jgi:hypothetical protein
MKEILFAGQCVLTTDDMADAVINYATVLAATGGVDVVMFPGFKNGDHVQCELVIGGNAGIASVTVPDAYAGVVSGAGEATAAIDRRVAELRDASS